MIKLIKVNEPGGSFIHFNATHVTHVRPLEEDTCEITLVHGEKLKIDLRADELAARIVR